METAVPVQINLTPQQTILIGVFQKIGDLTRQMKVNERHLTSLSTPEEEVLAVTLTPPNKRFRGLLDLAIDYQGVLRFRFPGSPFWYQQPPGKFNRTLTEGMSELIRITRELIIQTDLLLRPFDQTDEGHELIRCLNQIA